MEYVDNESILDVTAEIMCDLIPLREIIKEYEGENHFLGCQILREFTFNEESTESYIETIDECSMFDNLSNEDDQNILSDLRDEGASFHYQDLQSTYVGPPIIPSMDMTVLPNKLSFVDSVPSLLREKTDPSDYTYFDATKLKLFAGPYVWKYINLLPDLIKPSLPTNQSTSINNNRLAKTSVHPLYKTRRNFKLDLSNHDKQRSVNELMAINPLSKSIIKKQKRTILTNISQHNHQLRLSRSFCSINELMRSNNIPELIFDDKIQNLLNNSDPYPIHDDNYIADCNDEPFDYNFIRPIHYDRIEFDRNFTKIDTKKLQYQLIDEYNTESSKSSSLPITFSTLCVNLLDKNSLSIEKNELISAFYCIDLEEALEMGMDWSLREGYSWAEDKEHCEEYGRMLQADPTKVSQRAKKRGLPQLGTLGAGNHYAEIQVVDEIYDRFAAGKMGIDFKGQVCVMIHCGSRGLGHQVATDALVAMEKAMKRDQIQTNDRQLACALIQSPEGQDYLKGMYAAANYAWVNRSSMTFLARQAFARCFNSAPDDLDMHLIYDVSHNIAKVEEHVMSDGKQKTLLVHRKGATRAFPPHHPLIPVDYQITGQPVLIGGTMGTCSYVLTGTEQGMKETFGSTCHGAGRALSRAKSRRNLNWYEVLEDLKEKGIAIRVASPKLVQEEAPDSYKNVTDVVETCHAAGISKLAVKLRPIAVIKG
ncbi:unnamed protein product [Adineta steineri]|uniref:3'-phosphate/5'-hydroxy nucleic acid ligase n=1 Tax=Adineta steineri TaxID=433720 RepID=A0A815H9G9_9BILA|nr:unnamed protein product [Adineta steineri]